MLAALKRFTKSNFYSITDVTHMEIIKIILKNFTQSSQCTQSFKSAELKKIINYSFHKLAQTTIGSLPSLRSYRLFTIRLMPYFTKTTLKLTSNPNFYS